jgi:predicted nucleotide-binding protein (sugar kinase/HSP70/actin superfamily)
MTGTAGHYLKDNKIDGIIVLNAFGCGPDSLMVERIIRKAKQFNKPIINLTIDEQTGEAGFVTRIEAFVDMLFRKKRATIINKIDIEEETEREYTINTDYIETK